MNWILQIKERTFSSPSQQLPPMALTLQPNHFDLSNKVSPNVLIIIIILAAIFFISGLLHLLVRLLFRPPTRNPSEIESLTAMQGQLQQLFHLHDSGVDQSFIDALPVFDYKDIVGVNGAFDCAVCLCEFGLEDKLRLLPKCSHAFHMDCIDIWLLSHSTCPLCRANLVADLSTSHSPALVRILESGSESSREREDGSLDTGDGFGVSSEDPVGKSGEIGGEGDEISSENVVSVKLGKFKSVGGGDEGSGEISGEARRCFSMGSFAYVMDENSSLKVAVKKSVKKQLRKKPGHRSAMSECVGDSRREFFNRFDAFKVVEIENSGDGGSSVFRSKRESFSVSKIWLRGREDRANAAGIESSRRAVSFRFPVAACEWSAKSGGDDGSDRRRTFLGLMGRQNKVVDSSFSSNV